MVTYKHILFCTDFSDNAQAALPYAIDLAKKYGATLHLLHVYQERFRRLIGNLDLALEPEPGHITASPDATFLTSKSSSCFPTLQNPSARSGSSIRFVDQNCLISATCSNDSGEANISAAKFGLDFAIGYTMPCKPLPAMTFFETGGVPFSWHCAEPFAHSL